MSHRLPLSAGFSLEVWRGNALTAEGALRQARELREQDNGVVALMRLHHFLRHHALGFSDYALWGALISELVDAKRDGDSLPRVKIAILGGFTTEPLANAVRCALLGEGLLAEIYEGPFNAYTQEILNQHSALYGFAPELILLAPGWRNISGLPQGPVDQAGIEQALNAEVKRYALLWSSIEQQLGCPVLQHVFEIPEDYLLGAAENELAWSPKRFVAELNWRLKAEAPPHVRWLDVEALAVRVGRQNWFDARLYYHGKFGFSVRYLPEYARLFLGAWRATRGGTKKCVVVDLDNTLWGGVVGDDGIDGIRLGSGSAEGEAFADFAAYLSALKDRGVILAVCSKNDYATAAEVFETHPAMPLKLSDFAAFCCNWDDKAINLRRLAQELSIDLMSMVFVDDNPAERELVRRELPEVTVLELPEEPSLFRRCLDSQHYFDAFTISREDLQRGTSYAARRIAAEFLAAASDLDGYLASLEMQGELHRATADDLSRLAQMEMKTNQFNLTTRRYREKELANRLGHPDWICLAFTLRDRFADHGLVSSLLAVRERDVLRIDSWLMSCRIVSRTAEQFIMSGLIGLARQMGVRRIVGEFQPTPKNQLVSSLYPSLGFKPDSEADGRWWSLDMEEANRASVKTHIRSRKA